MNVEQFEHLTQTYITSCEYYFPLPQNYPIPNVTIRPAVTHPYPARGTDFQRIF
jgi:hypothetical protein